MSIRRRISLNAITYAFATLLLLVIPAASAERKIKRSDLPAAVKAAVAVQSQGAKVRGFSEEKENGKTYYEAEFQVSGHTKDVLMDQLTLLESKMSEVADDVHRNDTDRLLANGRFLEERFGRSALSLDSPATPS